MSESLTQFDEEMVNDIISHLQTFKKTLDIDQLQYASLLLKDLLGAMVHPTSSIDFMTSSDEILSSLSRTPSYEARLNHLSDFITR